MNRKRLLQIAGCMCVLALVTTASFGVSAAETETPYSLYEKWDTHLKAYTYDMCERYDLDFNMVLAIIYNESRFQAGATHLNTNGTTDWGLMQINDVCFSFEQRAIGIQSMEELLDPYKNIEAGCALLAYHKDASGTDEDALLRYQIGEGAWRRLTENEGNDLPDVFVNVITYRNELQQYHLEDEFIPRC